jgi:predicted lipoprotein
VYFRKLSEVNAEIAVHEFDAAAYADRYWEDEIIPAISNAIEISELLSQLNQNPELAFHEHSHALGIGNIRYFIIKGKGKIISINANDVTLAIPFELKQTQIHLVTEFVYGNAVRDAVGAIDLNEFTNTMDLNNVSAEINKRIRQHIIPPFKNQAKINAIVNFAGAIELNQKFLDLESIEVIPVSLKCIDYDSSKR